MTTNTRPARSGRALDGYGRQAREAKAVKIECALREQFAVTTAAAAAALTADQRRAVEARAGVNAASDETWGTVLAFMTDYDTRFPRSSP